MKQMQEMNLNIAVESQHASISERQSREKRDAQKTVAADVQ